MPETQKLSLRPHLKSFLELVYRLLLNHGVLILSLIYEISLLFHLDNSTSLKSNSKWISLRDKKTINKIRVQKFNEELKNVNNFMRKNELIFSKYAASKANNFLNFFGKAESAQKHRKDIMLPIKTNIIAQKFTKMLKQQSNAHNLNEKQIKIIRDPSYFRMTEFAKQRQKIRKRYSKFSQEMLQQNSLTTKAKYRILVCLNFSFECITKTKVFLTLRKSIKSFLRVKQPDGAFKICIDLISLILIFYEIVEIPLLLSFPEIITNSPQLSDVSTVINFYFLGDLLMNFNTAFYRRGTIVKRRKDIAKNYITTWFCLDFFSSFPYDMTIDSIMDVDSSNADDLNTLQFNSRLIKIIRFIKFLKILRLLRVMKLKVIFAKIEEYMQFSPTFNACLAFLRLCFLIICIAHWFACIWHLLAVYEESDYPVTWLKSEGISDSDWSERYVTSLYWAITTMITVGYGDITPLTVPEKLYTIFCMLLACGVFGYTMNRIGNIFQSFEENSMEYKDMARVKMFQINQYMKSKNVPKEMQARIRKYIQFTLDPEKRSQLDESSFFKCLSKNLKGEIILFINGGVISQYVLFTSLFSSRLLWKLPFFLNEQIYGPEEMIICENDVPRDNNIYFLRQGIAKAFIRSTDTEIAEFSNGSTFGQVGFFTDQKWICSVQSLDFISLFYLRRSDLLQVIHEEKFREDMETFCEIKDKLELYSDFDALNMSCSACDETEHLLNDCPFLHHTFNKEEMVRIFIQNESNFRNHFRRNINRKSFHSRFDFLLIQSSAQALRDVILIIKEEGIKENYKIEVDIGDLMDENPEGFPVLKKIAEFNRRNNPKASAFQEAQDQDSRFESITETRNRKVSKNFSRLVEIDAIFESLDLDRIENFSRYFPHNNLENLTKFANKRAAKQIEDFSKNHEGRTSQMVLNRMIKITKTKTIRNRPSKSPSPVKKKPTLAKENEKSPPSDKEKEKTPPKNQKPRSRFSIFSRRDEKPEKLDNHLKITSVSSKPEIRVSKLSTPRVEFELPGSKEITPLLESNPIQSIESEPKDLSPLSGKWMTEKPKLDVQKKRKSISCDGSYNPVDVLKSREFKELESILNFRKIMKETTQPLE